jgi:hypothetical protein
MRIGMRLGVLVLGAIGAGCGGGGQSPDAFASFEDALGSSLGSCPACSATDTKILASGQLTASRGGTTCTATLRPDETSAFAARATAPALLDALGSNPCPLTADGGEQMTVSLTDGRTFGPAHALDCPQGSPITDLSKFASNLAAEHCP